MGEQGTYTLLGLKDGGTYTLAMQGTGSTQFGSTGFASGDNSALKFYPAKPGPTLVNTQTIFTFIMMGAMVYYWMTAGVAANPTNP